MNKKKKKCNYHTNYGPVQLNWNRECELHINFSMNSKCSYTFFQRWMGVTGYNFVFIYFEVITHLNVKWKTCCNYKPAIIHLNNINFIWNTPGNVSIKQSMKTCTVSTVWREIFNSENWFFCSWPFFCVRCIWSA